MAHYRKVVMSHEPLISIVDDDEAVRDAVQALLESTGRLTVAFSSAEQFLASAALSAAQCLIVDLRMPGIDGVELLRRMRAAGHRIPTIVNTAHADEVERARALAAGAVAFLPKPFRPAVLLEAVEASLRRASNDNSGGS
jgi:FixJ family two-component response regulator